MIGVSGAGVCLCVCACARVIGTTGRHQSNLFHNFKEFLNDIIGDEGLSPRDKMTREEKLALWRDKPISEIPDSYCERDGSSYRKLPSYFVLPKCQGREDNEICVATLNDRWVSVPIDGDVNFKHVIRNKYEENLFKCEDERYELDMLIETNSSCILALEEIALTISKMTGDEKLKCQIKEDSNQLSAVHKRSIERVYGPDFETIMLQNIFKYPAVAVPVILTRLKQKSDDWIRLRVDYSREWQRTMADNFYKALDHRSFYFKQTDKKNISSKAIINDLLPATRQRGFAWKSDYPLSAVVFTDAYQLIRHALVADFADEEEIADCLAFWKAITDVFLNPDSATFDIVRIAQMEKAAKVAQKATEKAADVETKAEAAAEQGSGKGNGDGDSGSAGAAASPSTEDAAVAAEVGASLAGQLAGESSAASAVAAEEETPAYEQDQHNLYYDVHGAAKRSVFSPVSAVDGAGFALTLDPAARFGSLMSVDESSTPPSSPSTKVDKVAQKMVQLPALEAEEDPLRFAAAELAPARSIPTQSQGEPEATYDGAKRVLYANEQLYVYVRLHHLLLQRLAVARECAKREDEKTQRKVSKVSAVSEAKRENEKESGGDKHTAFIALLYQLVENNTDPITYEDKCRELLGTSSYVLFTMDKVVSRVVRQLYSVAMDKKVSRNLVQLSALHRVRMQNAPKASAAFLLDTQYREQVCELLDGESKSTCYRIELIINQEVAAAQDARAIKDKSKSSNKAPKLVKTSSRMLTSSHSHISITGADGQQGIIPKGSLAARVVLDPKASDAPLAPDRDEVAEAEAAVREMLVPPPATAAAKQDGSAPVFLRRNVRRVCTPSREARLQTLAVISNGLELVASVECGESDSEDEEENSSPNGAAARLPRGEGADSASSSPVSATASGGAASSSASGDGGGQKQKKCFTDCPLSKRRRLTNNYEMPRRVVYAAYTEDFMHVDCSTPGQPKKKTKHRHATFPPGLVQPVAGGQVAGKSAAGAGVSKVAQHTGMLPHSRFSTQPSLCHDICAALGR